MKSNAGYALTRRSCILISVAYNISTMRKDRIAKVMVQNLRKIRLSRRLTQAEVAERAGITTNHYARIERGVAIPSAITIAALAKGLKVKSSDILPY